VALGVLVAPSGEILSSGGYMIQPLPHASEDTLFLLEDIVKTAPQASEMALNKVTAKGILEELMLGWDLKILEEKEIQYECDCSRERMEKVLLSLGRQELEHLRTMDETTEIICHFCSTRYHFTREQIDALLNTLN
jgi:molecular chaperone Hsp33